jgi:hypothetical protein
LWLDRITQSGLAGGTLTLPGVQFSGIPMPNRVPEIDTAPLVNRYRVLGITAETGAVVSVNYSAPDCQPGGTMPSPHTNGRRCFPVYWKPEGAEHDDPEIYWFHKYVVDTVTEIDGTGGGVEREAHYKRRTRPARPTWSPLGVGLGSESRSAKWQPIDVRAGWVYDGERRASDAQVSSYPATGPNAEASLSVSGAGGLVRYEQGMSTHDRGSVHAVEVSITSPSLVDASAGASVSYGSEVADIGPLWR